jgi:hypothetical protein
MILGFLFWISMVVGFQDYTEVLNGEEFIHKPLFTEVEIHAESDYLDIYAVQNMEFYNNPVTFYPSPMQMESTIGVRLGTSKVSLNAEHSRHYPITQDYYYGQGKKQGGYNKI